MSTELTPAEQALSDSIHTDGGGTVLYDAEITDAIAAISPIIAADALDMAAAAWRIARNDDPSGLDPDPDAWLQRRAAALRSGTADEVQVEIDRLREENAGLRRAMADARPDYQNEPEGAPNAE